MTTKRLFLLIASAISSIVYIFFFVQYDKLGAHWGWLSVPMVGIILTVILGVGFLFIPWYFSEESTPWLFINLALVVIFLSLYGGVYMTEPSQPGALTSEAGLTIQPDDPEYPQVAYSRSRAGSNFTHIFYSNYGSGGNSSGTVGSIPMPKCSGKSCNGIAMLFLIILALIVILGSLFVPHFWVAGAMIFIGLIWLMTVREWFVVERSESLSKLPHQNTYDELFNIDSKSKNKKPKNDFR